MPSPGERARERWAAPDQDLISEARRLAARTVTAGRTHDESRAFAVAAGLADALDSAHARIAELEAAHERVSALVNASDDGSEYEHDHGIGDGHDQCPACWAEDIRNALREVDGDV